jgi:membrane protein required for colicin V production
VTVFDYAVLGIVSVSIVLSLMRGFVREALGLVGWLASAWIAKGYAVQVAAMLPGGIPNDSLRLLAGFMVVFLGVLVAASLLSVALSDVVKRIGLSTVDRGLGLLFGAVRGLLIVGVIVLMAGLTALPQRDEWQNAMLSPPLEAMVTKALPWLPQDFVKHVKF